MAAEKLGKTFIIPSKDNPTCQTLWFQKSFKIINLQKDQSKTV